MELALVRFCRHCALFYIDFPLKKLLLSEYTLQRPLNNCPDSTPDIRSFSSRTKWDIAFISFTHQI